MYFSYLKIFLCTFIDADMCLLYFDVSACVLLFLPVEYSFLDPIKLSYHQLKSELESAAINPQNVCDPQDVSAINQQFQPADFNESHALVYFWWLYKIH